MIVACEDVLDAEFKKSPKRRHGFGIAYVWSDHLCDSHLERGIFLAEKFLRDQFSCLIDIGRIFTMPWRKLVECVCAQNEFTRRWSREREMNFQIILGQQNG